MLTLLTRSGTHPPPPPPRHPLSAAALWTTAKLSGVRSQIPNRSLVSQATHINAQVR